MSSVPKPTKEALVDFLQYLKRVSKKHKLPITAMDEEYVATWYLREKEKP